MPPSGGWTCCCGDRNISDSPTARGHAPPPWAVGAPAWWARVDFPRVSNLHLRTSVWYSRSWIWLGNQTKGWVLRQTPIIFGLHFHCDEKVLILRVKIVPWGLLAISMSCETCHLFSSTKEKEFIIAAAYEINQKLPVKSCKQLANCVSLHNLWRLFGAIYVPIQNRVLPSQFVIFYSYYLCTWAGRG